MRETIADLQASKGWPRPALVRVLLSEKSVYLALYSVPSTLQAQWEQKAKETESLVATR